MINDFSPQPKPKQKRQPAPKKSVATAANKPKRPPKPPQKKSNPQEASFDKIRLSSYKPNKQQSKSKAKKKRFSKARHFWYSKNWSKKQKALYWIGVTLLAIGLLFGSWFAYRLISGTSGIFSGSYTDLLLSSQPLERDQYGRSNVLVFGTTEDEDGGGSQLLTDSILVISIDQDGKYGNIISIPRDLWVEYSQPCPNGTAGKINAIYSCGIQNGLSEIQASEAFADKIGEVIGTDIPYIIKVNQLVLKEVVDALDGIQVTIDSPDPRGIFDRATGLELPNGITELDGETALALSRARNASGGYGLPRSNFDREQNQQQVIRAIQQEALSTGTLTNPNRVLSLAESLGDNVLTNLPSRQVRTVIDVARGTNADNIVTIELVERDAPLVTTGQEAGQSIVLPTAGLFNYNDIQVVISQKFQASSTASLENL